MANWLENLKEGDLVIVHTRMTDRVRKVEKITPTGKIRVDGELYAKNGTRGNDLWSVSILMEATPEAIEKIRNKSLIANAIALMKSEKAANINVEQAKAIIKILEGDKQ